MWKSYISIFSRKGLKKKEFLNSSPLLVLPLIHLLNIWINDSFVFLSKKIIFYFQWTFRFRKAPLIGSEKLWQCYISSPYKWQYLYMLVIVDALPNLTLLGRGVYIAILHQCKTRKYNTLNISLFKLSMRPNINPHLEMQMQKSNWTCIKYQWLIWFT